MSKISDKINQYLAAQREAIATVAGAKIGRPLTSEEVAGIDHISSGMMLECIYMSFSHVSTAPEAVLADLASLASQAKPQLEPPTEN